MKYTKPKSLPKQKAAKGLHEVTVPPTGNSGDVLNGAMAGASAGSAFGPYGMAIGAVAGFGKGLYDSNQADQANREAVQHNQVVQANDRVSGVDITRDQRGQYGQGTPAIASHKPIEVEKDELVFRKVGDKFRLKADFQKGKPHSQGGEDYLAKQGDVIFPGNQRGKVLAAYKEGNHSKLEGLRLKLPKDTNPQGKASSGADLLNPDAPTQYLPSRFAPGTYNANQANRYGAYGAFPQAVEGLTNGSSTYFDQDPLGNYKGSVIGYQDPRNRAGQLSYYQYSKPSTPAAGGSVGFTNRYAPDSPSLHLNTPDLTLPSPASPASSTGQETGQGAGLGNALKYASVANNLVQGFSSPERVQESYLDPILNTYQDRSDPQRRQSNMVRNAQVVNARNSSGGMVSNLRANQQIAEAEGYGRRQEIDNREQGIADQVRFGNTEEVRRVKGINSQKLDGYNQLNGQARANAQAYKDAAFGQLSSLGNAQEQDAYKKSRDTKMDARDKTFIDYLNQTTHYQTDGNGGPVTWNPNGVAGYLGNTPSTTTKEDTDIYGRKKSSTSITTKPTIRRRK